MRASLLRACALAALLLNGPLTVFAASAAVPMLRLELEMLHMVNRDREQEALAPLKWNGRAAEVARSHSRDMAMNRFFAHRSPTSGEAGDRFFAARIPTFSLAENLARAATLEDAERELLQSPGHRKNLLNPEFTEIGIGILRDSDNVLYVTQNFLAPIELVNPAEALAAWQRQVNEQRVQNGSTPLRPSYELTTLAQQHSAAMADQGKLQSLPRESIKALRGFKTVGSAVLFAPSVDHLSKLDKPLESRFEYLGVAAVRNMTKAEGYGMLWITLVVAAK